MFQWNSRVELYRIFININSFSIFLLKGMRLSNFYCLAISSCFYKGLIAQRFSSVIIKNYLWRYLENKTDETSSGIPIIDFFCF